MAPQIIYERFLWFHEHIKDERYPNAASLAAHFEVTRKTAQRNIEFMRDRLFAPLVYVAERRGYIYEDDAYELPASWLGEEVLTALLVSARLASTIPDPSLKTTLRDFLDRVVSLHSGGTAASLAALAEKVSVKNIEYSRTDGRIFHQVLDHLLQNRTITIAYYSPHADETTKRDILPLHLLQYMGTWHMIAYCGLREEVRDFILSRIRSVTPADRRLDPDAAALPVQDYIRQNFGIMRGDAVHDVCLRFSPAVSPWVAEQIWHRAQVARHEPDGALCLSFPVADFREIKREVLKFGAQVEVLAPPALRAEVGAEVARMGRLYREKNEHPSGPGTRNGGPPVRGWGKIGGTPRKRSRCNVGMKGKEERDSLHNCDERCCDATYRR